MNFFSKLLLLALVISCSKPIEKDYLVISGNVKNTKRKRMRLTGFNFEKEIEINSKNGNFIDTLRIPRTGYYNIIFNSSRTIKLYLTKTDDIKIQTNFKNVKKTTFEGTNASINKYFIDKSKLHSSIIISAYTLFKYDEELFTQTIERYKDSLTELCISNNFPENFQKKELRGIDYEIIRNINNYQDNHRTLIDSDEFTVSDSFYDNYPPIGFNNTEDYKDFFSYRKIIEESLTRKSSRKESLYLGYLKTIIKNVKDSLIINDLFFKKGETAITYTDKLEEYFNFYIQNSSNKYYNSKITDKYNILKLTAKGKTSPKFYDYKNFNGGTNSLDDFLNNGKYLFIDIWATWCGYCAREIPLLKRYEVLYQDKNIEFIGISADNQNDFEKWKRTIVKNEQSGHQLFSDNAMESEFFQKYAIEGLPRFIILDPEGKIVTPNAPRPSEGDKLENLINSLDI